MTPAPRITSLANDRVKDLVRLRTRRERDRTGLFLIEEPLVLERALDAGQALHELWHCPERLDPAAAELVARAGAGGTPLVEAAPQVMDKIAYRDRSEGLLAVAPRRRRTLDGIELPADRPALVVVLENVEKPGNLGTVLRTADGAGADLVVCAGGGVDLDNPNCLRASRGAFFTVPVVAADLDATVAWLTARGIPLLAAHPAGDAYWDGCDLRGPVALALGAEHDGLSPALLEAAPAAITLPMAGSGDSLNVAATAAILLYEAVRQRRSSRKAEDR